MKFRHRSGIYLGGLYPPGNVAERREESRYPYPYLIHLTPVDEDGQSAEGESIVAVGKHLSNRGLGFYHPKPTPLSPHDRLP